MIILLRSDIMKNYLPVEKGYIIHRIVNFNINNFKCVHKK